MKKVLHERLRKELSAIGFDAIGELCYRRTVGACKQLINVECRMDGGMLKFSCTLGLRFDDVESILRPQTKDECYPTVSCPIHVLRPERTFYEWEGSCDAEFEISASSLATEVREVGLTFFDQFATLESVGAHLSSDEVSDYFMLASHQRVGVLAAISIVNGDRANAESVLAMAMNDPRNRNPGKKRRIEELQKQLLPQ